MHGIERAERTYNSGNQHNYWPMGNDDPSSGDNWNTTLSNENIIKIKQKISWHISVHDNLFFLLLNAALTALHKEGEREEC